MTTNMGDRLSAALADRPRLERELGAHAMAPVRLVHEKVVGRGVVIGAEVACGGPGGALSR